METGPVSAIEGESCLMCKIPSKFLSQKGLRSAILEATLLKYMESMHLFVKIGKYKLKPL
jgi:hypothetical protein